MQVLSFISKAKVTKFDYLTPVQKKLILEAERARQNAYAPYSKYLVGAAVLVSEKIFCGCNVECATYTQTIHAEINALSSAIAHLQQKPVKLEKIAIVAAPKNSNIVLGEPIKPAIQYKINEISVPCGQCLQFIWEFCCGNTEVELIGLLKDGQVSITTIGDVFPIRFELNK